MTNPVPVLSDDALREIEVRHELAEAAFAPYQEVSDSLADIPALCATVRALRSETLKDLRIRIQHLSPSPKTTDKWQLAYECCKNECISIISTLEAANTKANVAGANVQCADCFAWIAADLNHTCRQQIRRNQRRAK